MLHTEYENRLSSACRENEAPLSMATPPKRRLIHSAAASPVSPLSTSSLSASPRKPAHSDRLTPSRLGARWNINYQLMQSEAAARSESKKNRDGSVENSKDTQMYLCMLRNELLGAEISDVRLCPSVGGGGAGSSSGGGGGSVGNQNSVGAGTAAAQAQETERKVLAAVDPVRLYTYRSPRCVFEPPSNTTSPYSISPLSNASQALLRSPRKTARKISKMPFKVLDAPELQDDFYLNLVDWSSQNVLAVGLGASVWLWFACTSQVTRLCDLSVESDSVTSVAWTEKGNLVAVGTHHGLVQIWDVATSKRINTIQGHLARVGALAWNGDSQICSGSRDRFIQQKDIRTPPTVPDRRLQGHRQEVCGLKWSPDNQHLASGGNDNKLHVWNLHSNQPVQTYGDHVAAVKAIAWSPHHHGLLASGGGTADRCIRFWNTLTGQAMQCVDTGSQVCNLAWSKHSSELVSTHGYSQNQILLWKYPSLVQVAKLTGHSLRVLYLAMSPCGESIVTGAGDETLRFWSVFSKARSPKQIRSALDPFANLR